MTASVTSSPIHEVRRTHSPIVSELVIYREFVLLTTQPLEIASTKS
jgi:hypothetical protein